MHVNRVAAHGAALVCLCVGAVLATAPAARAGDVTALAPNAHTLADGLDPGEEHYVPLELPEGALLTLQFRANRKLNKANQLVPEAELIGPDGATVGIPSSYINPKKGFDVKKLPIEETGRYMLILRGATSAGGQYTLKVKAKLPKKVSGELDGNGAALEIPFACTGGARVGAKVSGPKGGAVPELPRVRQPNDNAFGPVKLATKKNGFSFKNFEQNGEFGVYALTFQITPESAAGDRTFKYKISVKWPKAAKRTVLYSDLVIAPLVTSVAPNDLPVAPDTVGLRVEGRFFQPGAQIFLEMAGQPDWLPRNQVVDENGITAPIQTLAQAPGRWDVIAANPSGGQAEIKRALLIRPATPGILSVTPPFTTDDLSTASVTIVGNQLSSTTTIRFRRELPLGGEEVFDPTNVQNASGGGILVTFSPFRRAIGTYDVIAQNPGPDVGVPGSEVATAEDVFEIRNAPPRLTSATPDRNLDGGAFTMTISGVEMESGAQAFLQREGETDVPATQESVSPDGTRLTAVFDMDGRAVGGWDLLVVNPDAQQAGLESAFAVPDTATLTPTNAFLGEPTVSLATEHDMGLVAWIESDEDGGGGSSWTVKVRRFDLLLNSWIGDPVEVSSPLQGSVSKRYVSTSYNPDVDEWLVVWTEHTFQSRINERVRAGMSVVSGTVYHVYGRRVTTDGSTAGNVVDFIDNTLSATGSGQIYEEFEYSNPQVVHAGWDGNWYMTFTQRWDNLTDNGSYINDDYDVFVWRLAKDDPKLDTSFHLAIHTTQNHEGDCLAAVDDDQDKLFVVGSCDSRQLAAVNPREIEAKWVTSGGGIEFGSGGSNVGQVLAVSARGSESENFTNPRPAYNPDAREFLVVYERIDESGSGKKQIWARRVSATQQSALGSEIVVGEDDSNDCILPRVVYNADTEQYLVTWTLDAGAGSARAQGRLLDGADAQPDGASFDLDTGDSGLPCIVVDTVRGNYVGVHLQDYGAFDEQRTGDTLTIRLFD